MVCPANAGPIVATSEETVSGAAKRAPGAADPRSETRPIERLDRRPVARRAVADAGSLHDPLTALAQLSRRMYKGGKPIDVERFPFGL
jgi:hypothetical protein